MSTPPPYPSLQQSRRYFRAENVTWLPGCYRAIGYFLIATRRPRSNIEGSQVRHRFSLLLPQLFHFLVEIAIEPCWALITVIN